MDNNAGVIILDYPDDCESCDDLVDEKDNSNTSDSDEIDSDSGNVYAYFDCDSGDFEEIKIVKCSILDDD